jgi:hypothetical protein
MRVLRRAIGVCAALLITGTPVVAATITVAAGANLQQAIDSAVPGETIALAPGATFTGNFTLPARIGDAVITIRTAGDDGLPADGERVSPANVGTLAVVRASGTLPAIRTLAGAHHWRLLLLEIQGIGGGDLIALGDGSSAQTAASQIPHDLVVDRLYIHGDADKGQKRGIALNSASTSILSSYISDIKLVGQDSQAICGWNGPGPFVIANNYLEAAGENMMFGGSDPSVPNLVPADIVVDHNLLSKRVSWQTERWSVKNLIELKNARRVMISDNTFENNWDGAQPGFAIVFTVRNQDGKCPWCQVDHVTFERNIVRHVAAGIKILGWDNNHPSQQGMGRQRLLPRDDRRRARYHRRSQHHRAGECDGDRSDRRSAGTRFRVHEQPVDIRHLRNRRYRPRFRQRCHRRIFARFRYLAERHRGRAGRQLSPKQQLSFPRAVPDAVHVLPRLRLPAHRVQPLAQCWDRRNGSRCTALDRPSLRRF